MLPKIHKTNNPGRPVISSINCHTANISKFVDFHLQDHVIQLPSYVKDTKDFINKIEKITSPEGSILVTMDVFSIYTNIPNVKQSNQYEKHCQQTGIYIISFIDPNNEQFHF